MSTVRGLDANGDWNYGKGQNDYKSANAAVAQDIQTRLLSFFNDCFFDTGAGLDWFNLLGNKDQTALNLAINGVILNTANVTGIIQTSVALSPVTRQLVVTYQITTTYSLLTSAFSYNLNGTV